MKTAISPLQRTAWLFIARSGEASVTMTVIPDGSEFVLVIRGPGAAEANHKFRDMRVLLAFANAYEERLMRSGFQLQAFSERRVSGDTGGTSPGAADRRRS